MLDDFKSHVQWMQLNINIIDISEKLCNNVNLNSFMFLIVNNK